MICQTSYTLENCSLGLRLYITYFKFQYRFFYFSQQVMVHTSNDFPDVSIGYKLHATRDQINRISVSVAQVRADKSLKNLDEKDNRCSMYNTMSNENTGFYKINDEDTCYSECRLRTIYRVCNCTQYFFKPYKGNQTNQM